MENLPTISIDTADPHALAELLPEPLKSLAATLPVKLLVQDEETLTQLVNPSEQQKRIKILFWEEYNAAMRQDRLIVIGNIIFGVCTRDYFLNFIDTPRNVAWMLSPKPSYQLRIAELIEKGLDCLEQIFKMDVTDKTAVSVRNLQMAALRMIDMRKYGGYTQRQETKTLSKTEVHQIIDAPQTETPPSEESLDVLLVRLQELQLKVRHGSNQNGSLIVREKPVVGEQAVIIGPDPGLIGD